MMASNLLAMASNLLAMANDGQQLTSDGLHPTSDGLQPTSDGPQPKSNVLQQWHNNLSKVWSPKLGLSMSQARAKNDTRQKQQETLEKIGDVEAWRAVRCSPLFPS